ncbi:unnamed protein product [Effrenium voratum]|nr:unnamed protein product [Effrenium voratum]
MSSTSFIFDDEDEEMTTVPSGRLRCGRCVWETSVTVQCCYIYVLAVAVAGVLVAFGVQMPHQVALGAFGSLKQVDLPGAVADAYFQSVHLEAIDLQSGGPFDAGHAPHAAGSFESFEWHSLELIWQMGPSQSEREKDFQPSVVSDTYMSEVRLAEVALRELPGWVSLCNACPAEVRFLCTAGDSLVALSFGSWQESHHRPIRLWDWSGRCPSMLRALVRSCPSRRFWPLRKRYAHSCWRGGFPEIQPRGGKRRRPSRVSCCGPPSSSTCPQRRRAALPQLRGGNPAAQAAQDAGRVVGRRGRAPRLLQD